jgi:uncharacterized membrane protein
MFIVLVKLFTAKEFGCKLISVTSSLIGAMFCSSILQLTEKRVITDSPLFLSLMLIVLGPFLSSIGSTIESICREVVLGRM